MRKYVVTSFCVAILLVSACSEPDDTTVDMSGGGYIDMTRYGQSDLYEAIHNGDLEAFTIILTHDVDPNYYFSEETWDSRPGIMELAVMHRQDFFLQAALANRGDANALTASGNESIAFIAVTSNDQSKLAILIEKGANINAADHNGYTLFHKAVQIRNFEIASYLYEQGANTQTPDQWQYTPLDTLRKFSARELVDDSDDIYVQLKRKLIRDEATLRK